MKESPIFIKTYDLTKWLLEHTIKFPRSQRFVMAKRVEEAVLNFHDLLIQAVKEKEKREILTKAGFELERLKHYLRLCTDLGILSIKQYEYSSTAIVEIGNLLGGWMKKTAHHRSPLPDGKGVIEEPGIPLFKKVELGTGRK